MFGDDGVHINIFNIARITSEVRGGKAPRIKRLSEYIGQSYFDYLSKLDDLVLLMDESHRYRAAAGLQAINDLRPVLGLELTATPQVEVALKHPKMTLIANALGTPPKDMIDHIHAEGRTVAALRRQRRARCCLAPIWCPTLSICSWPIN